MKISESIDHFYNYQRLNVKKKFLYSIAYNVWLEIGSCFFLVIYKFLDSSKNCFVIFVIVPIVN